MAKRRRKSSAKKCHKTQITFKKKRGGVVSFLGKTGKGCGPRPKPKTGHLRSFKSAFKTAVRACKGKSHKRAGKHGKSAFNKCIGAKL